MAANNKSQLRIKILDRIFKSGRKYSIEQLTQLVIEDLMDYQDDIKNPKKITITTKTIRNDIKDMLISHPVNIINKGGKFYYESPDDSIDNLNIRENDRNVIEMALQIFSNYKGSSYFEKFNDVFSRVLESSVLRKLQKNIPKFIQIGETIGDSGQQWIEPIYQAISDKRCLLIHYNPYGQNTKIRTISPYILKEYRNKWYMVAHAKEITENGSTNLFKLFRIQKIELSDSEYYVDPTFNANAYFKYSLGVFHSHELTPIDVKMKFKKHLIPLISENKLHHTMEIISQSQDEITARIKVYNTVELKTLILGFGSGIQVISPLDLKNEIIEELKNSLKNYN